MKENLDNDVRRSRTAVFRKVPGVKDDSLGGDMVCLSLEKPEIQLECKVVIYAVCGLVSSKTRMVCKEPATNGICLTSLTAVRNGAGER